MVWYSNCCFSAFIEQDIISPRSLICVDVQWFVGIRQAEEGKAICITHSYPVLILTGCEPLSEVLPAFWPLLSLRIPHTAWRWMMGGGGGRYTVHSGDICIVCQFIKLLHSSFWTETDSVTAFCLYVVEVLICPHSLYRIKGNVLHGKQC